MWVANPRDVVCVGGLRAPARGFDAEARMDDHCCRNCAYAMRPRGRWLRICLSRFPGLLLCVNNPEILGEPVGMPPSGCCENWRLRVDPPVRVQVRQPRDPKIRCIGLTKNKVALVDAADFPWLSLYKWSAMKRGRTFYARRRRGRRMIMMHREIMQPEKGMVVDHKNRHGLDNRRENLRVCTAQENGFNIGPAKGAEFRGVYPYRDMWEARILHKGELHWLGLFDTPIEAARARDRKAIELYGRFAYLNLPEEAPVEPKGDPAADKKG